MSATRFSSTLTGRWRSGRRCIEAGKPFGLQPTGLAARDSTRTEAGLPLYGHELAGHFNISPAGARFAAYVKLHKPYFIGRDAYLAKEKERTMEVARFRMNDKGVRMPKTGDPVVNKKGQALGWVTERGGRRGRGDPGPRLHPEPLREAGRGDRDLQPAAEAAGREGQQGRARSRATRSRSPTARPCSRASPTRPSGRTGGVLPRW